MATITFHPTSDITLGHSCSTGSTGWNLLGSNDGDSTYINGRCNSDSTKTYTSNFGFSGAFDKAVIVKSIAIYVVGRTLSTNSKDTKNYSINLSINGTAGTAKSGTLDSSYTTYSNTYTQGLPSNPITDIGQLNLNLQITNSGKQESSKTDAFNNYFTEAYIVVTYEESTIPSYKCAAIAGANIDSASVSSPTVLDGESVTFTAVASQYCTFDGWYTSASGGTPVSGSDSYTAIIHDHTTLYARAVPTLFNASIGAQPSYGSASVSSGANAYGASVTFTCNVSSTDKEFWGWYSDAGHTTLVSASSTYTTTQPASSLVLYPYIGDIRHYVTITCAHMMDVKPFRFNGSGSYNNGKRGASRSLIQNQNNIIGKSTMDGSVYAYQDNYKYESDFNFGISFHFTGGAENLPDNANIIGVTGHIGLATAAGSQYKNIQLFAGEMDYIEYNNSTIASDQPDETAVVNRRGSARSLTITAAPTDYTLSPAQMGTWTANEIKNGRCGIELDFTHSGNQSALNIYLAKIEVVYTYNYTTYNCEAVSDGNCDVFTMDAESSNPRYYDDNLLVTSGNKCTWFARPKGGYRFDGWYSDANHNNLVTEKPVYTTTVNADKTLYAKTHYVSRVISKTLTVPFKSGSTYYEGYYSDNGITKTKTSAGSNGFQVDMDMSTGIYAFTGLDCDAALGCTNGKQYIYGLLNATAKNALFPNDTAHPVAMDWYDEAGRGSATISIVSRNPTTENETISLMVGNDYLCHQRPSLIAGVGCTLTNLRDECILTMTKGTEIGYKFRMTNASRSKASGVNTARYTLYFEEYDFSAQIGTPSKGIEAVATNKAIGYEGDSVTFTATLLPGVTFDGWYDSNGKKVSGDTAYTCTPNISLTLYAKASTPLNIYSVSATADAHVASANCDHIIMTDGNPVTFTATVNEPGWAFEGWYLNDTKLSSDNTYSYIINTDTTLVAKAKQLNYTITVEQGTGGTATATPSSGTYNTESTLEWEDALGWYDFEKWQIAGFVRPALTEATIYVDQAIDVGDWGPFAAPEEYYNIGDFHWNNAKYVYPTGLNECDVIWDDELFMNVPISDCSYTRYNGVGKLVATYVKVIGGKEHGYPFGFYSAQDSSRELIVATDNKIKHEFGLFIDNRISSIAYTDLSTNNPYTHLIVDNVSVRAVASEKPWYHCAVEGEHTNLVSISATQGHVIAGTSVTFSYNGGSSYEFFGWYTDAECTQLITEDTSYTFTPNEDVIIYAKIQQAVSTGVYIRQNGVYIVAKAVYKKVNGVYVEQTDPQSIFDSTKHYKTIIT
ncbi:MAG: InlB B-repeat-containing protein [Prevotellaceae bacterium]|nr:InlB B-repeat-containing protein [Candidatus Faecinaster equi]